MRHCDSKSASEPKIMALIWNTSASSGIEAGNDPSVTEDSSQATGCPEVLTPGLIGNETQSLISAASTLQSLSLSSTLLTNGKLESVTVRSNATESLYFALFYSSNQYLAAVLHCDEKTPTQLDVLNVASYASKDSSQKKK
jgi:hypothetical protein